MKQIKIKNSTFSSANPAICVSVTKMLPDFIFKDIRSYVEKGVDVIEIRADFWGSMLKDPGSVCDLVEECAVIAGDTPLLFTVRSKVEGGEAELSEEELFEIYKALLEKGNVDVYDVELFSLEKGAELLKMIKEKGAIALASHHSFKETYSREGMLEKLNGMKAAGADIAKLAMMPNSKEDVINLLAVSEQFDRENDDIHVISISMGELGMVSRLACSLTGSMLTFAAIGGGSAPGQITFDKLKGVLK